MTGEDAGAHCISFVSDAPGNGLRPSQPFPIRPVCSHPPTLYGTRVAGRQELGNQAKVQTGPLGA